MTVLGRQPTAQPRLARSAVAGVTGAVLVALSGDYGYHRDELYFLAAGAHPAWGYPDQPPLTPLIAWATTSLLGDSLVALRLPAALATAAVVLLTALIAREFGARPGAQVLAAGGTAVSAFVIAVGHLLSTATFDLLAWTALSWLLTRALRDGGPVWLVAGLGLENKTLLAFYLAALAVGLLVVSPRAALRSPWLCVGVVALALWAPNLWWQATHGWPLRELSTSIAAGGSASSAPRWLFLPFQLVLVSLVLVAVWVIGLWRLLRDPALRMFRLFGIAYFLLAALFLVTGGKPYYLACLYPVLLAAGAQPVLDWARRGAVTLRSGLVAAALAVSAAVSVELVATVAGVHRDLPPGERGQAVILAENHGEAGALQQARSRLGLPPVFSGHNGFGEWGPPPDGATPTIAVGLDRVALDELFASVTPVARIDNGLGLDTEEQGRTVWVCREQRRPWSQVWSQICHIG
ncbi:MAG: glycosyltransferase family 39 protein [Pseudonocardiaceae bacterium]